MQRHKISFPHSSFSNIFENSCQTLESMQPSSAISQLSSAPLSFEWWRVRKWLSDWVALTFRLQTTVKQWEMLASCLFAQMINQADKVLTLQMLLISGTTAGLRHCPFFAFSVFSFLKQTIGLYWFLEHHSQMTHTLALGTRICEGTFFYRVSCSTFGYVCQGGSYCLVHGT